MPQLRGDRATKALHLCVEGFRGFAPNHLANANLKACQDESLVFVFRLLFVMYSEDRGLLSDAGANRKSLRSHRVEIAQHFDSGAAQRYSSVSTEIWDSVSSCFEACGRLCGGELFRDSAHSFLQRHRIADSFLARVIDELGRVQDATGKLAQIDYRHEAVQRLGEVYETLLETKSGVGTTSKRRSSGSYYTPAPIVDFIVESTLRPICEALSDDDFGSQVLSLKILDPSMGTGNFLIRACQWLADEIVARQSASDLATTRHWRRRVAENCLYGVDSDHFAVELAKLAIWLETVTVDATPEDPRPHFRCGDSLVDKGPKGASRRGFHWHREFPEVFAETQLRRGFDAVIGNPPYLNIRLVTQQKGEAVKQYLRANYRCARRGFDLYVLFIEKSLRLLRSGGRCGLVVPNKVATLDYAEPCRSLLLEDTTLETIADVSHLPVFPKVGVYPYVIVWEKSPPSDKHCVAVLRPENLGELADDHPRLQLRQADLSAAAGFAIGGELCVEARVRTTPLDEVATLHSGTTGFGAQRMLDALVDTVPRDGDCFDFIVSRNIDRYSVVPGSVRFMKRDFQQPQLATTHSILTENKRRLFAERKIVVAGLTRRIEAAFDPGGLALGVQVYAASALSVNPHYLLGLLNSKLMSYLFRLRFQAKRLAGGFLAVNKGQLARLPIRAIETEADEILHDNVAELAVQMSSTPTNAIDRELDETVYALYRLTADEICSVENSFKDEQNTKARRTQRRKAG